MMIMKKVNRWMGLLLLLCLLAACQSYKKVPYLQDAEVVLYGVQNEQLYDAKIMPRETEALYKGNSYCNRTNGEL